MLTLENLSCGYGAVRAVHDLSFELPAGTLLALLGPNGAGKTSTIMAIMGHIDIYSGRVVYEGADITRRRAVDRAELGIALVPEGRQLFPDLTVDENLTVGGYAHTRARDKVNRERVFLVDELSLGLMPKMVDLCLKALLDLKRDGVTILLVEQNTARALDVADQVIVLSSGAVVFRGSAAQAKAEHSLFATFLGMPEQIAT
jgi:branched-chain amino acid transport system ATP-binding protein